MARTTVAALRFALGIAFTTTGCVDLSSLTDAGANADMAAGPANDLAPDPCENGRKDGDETDVDCGGGTCPSCPIGKACALGTDCMTGTCTNDVCTAAKTCMNGMKDGDETDVDCGGSCMPCLDGKICMNNADCQSNTCQGGTCAKASVACTFDDPNSAFDDCVISL